MSGRSLMFQRFVWLAALLTVELCVRAHGQDCMWVDHHTGGPDGGSEYAMAYDSLRGVSVLFEDDSTWEWDGVTWLLRTTGGPSKRFGQAMAYDSARGVAVLFGGSDFSIGYVGDTWEWDGTTWTLRSTLGPSPRVYHKMAYDSVRGFTVLFGGGYYDYGYHYYEDTWEWDGTTWTQRTSAGPSPPRLGHAMAYDSARGETVLFGGWNSDAVLGDTWAWDGESWRLKSNSGPTARSSTPLAFDSARGVTVLFGGWSDSGLPLGDTWEWDGTTWAERNVLGPGGSGGHAMVYDSHRGVTVLFGGYTLGAADEPVPLDYTVEWTGTSWSRRFSSGPRPSTYMAMAYDNARQATVLFASGSYSGAPIETWEWRGTAWTLQSTTGPPARSSHAMAFDSARVVTVLFGGWRSGSGALSDTWEWDGTSWTQRDGIGPSPREAHAMAYDSSRGVTVLFGGYGKNVSEEALGDTWEWDGTSWTLRSTSGPSPRFWHAMAYDSARSVTVLSGGRHLYEPLGDTWEWDGTMWTLRTSTGPSPRHSHAMAYDNGRSVTVLYGGYSAGTETWEWDGLDWTMQSASAPSYREGHAMAYDSERWLTVVFGGSGRADTWEYGCPCPLIPRKPVAEAYRECPGICYAMKNRYLSFTSPPIPCSADSVALRVTFGPMPGPNDCPKVPNFSAFDGVQMWVGPEVLRNGVTPTGLYELQSIPLFRDWTTVPTGVIQLSDCNIVPCATYTIEAVTDVGYPSGAYSIPLVLSTTPTWGDIVSHSYGSGDGIVDVIDVMAMVDRLKNTPGAPPGTWCDLYANRPSQGVNLNIDVLDIVMAVDALKGFDYPFSGPSAPEPCPGTP